MKTNKYSISKACLPNIQRKFKITIVYIYIFYQINLPIKKKLKNNIFGGTIVKKMNNNTYIISVYLSCCVENLSVCVAVRCAYILVFFPFYFSFSLASSLFPFSHHSIQNHHHFLSSSFSILISLSLINFNHHLIFLNLIPSYLLFS